MSSSPKSSEYYLERITLLILLLAAFFVRIIGATYARMPHYTIDSYNYIWQADILRNGGYSNYFPNGYPLIILLVSLFSPLETGLLWLNIILSLFTVLFVYLIAKGLTRNIKIALLCAAIVTLYPNQVNYVHFILTEVPCTFFLALSVYLFQKEKLAYSGLAMGAALIIRTTIVFVPVILFVYLFLNSRKKESIIYFISFLIIPVSLMLYGYFVSGDFTLGRNFTHNIYVTIKQPYKISYTKIQGVVAYCNAFISSPVQFLSDRLRSFWNLWGFLPYQADGFRGGLAYRLLVGLRFPLLILGIYGWLKSAKNSIPLLLILPAVSITIIHTLFFSSTRFTFPAEPFLIILAVIGIRKILRNNV
ncbi:MAG: glycosyltransferase family 39 protein [Ignavibacteriaceae bacterium]|nr:glycosyltransferase family 39 protein [Ignavibacteriaceae bacterium]